MTEEEHNRRAGDRVPKWLLPTLVLLIVLGALSVGATLQAARESDVARSSQVDRVERLIERLDDVADRNRTSGLLGHRCILDALEDVAAEEPVELPEECDTFERGDGGNDG